LSSVRTAPKGHNMSAQGKQPRAPRQALPCVVGLHHAQPRLRSPGLRTVISAQSPERAQQMAVQKNTDSQNGSIHRDDQCQTTSRRNLERALLRVASRGTAAPVRGECCARSRLLGMFVTGHPGLTCCGPFGAKACEATSCGKRREYCEATTCPPPGKRLAPDSVSFFRPALVWYDEGLPGEWLRSLLQQRPHTRPSFPLPGTHPPASAPTP
jgi:hypothetical protein